MTAIKQPLPPLTTAEEWDVSNIEQSPWSAIVQWINPNASFHLQWYVVFGVAGRGDCSHSWTHGRTKEQAEMVAKRFSTNFLGYFDTSTGPWPQKEILKIAQQKHIVPQVDFNKEDPVSVDFNKEGPTHNYNECW